jgi:hypothetical protein
LVASFTWKKGMHFPLQIKLEKMHKTRGFRIAVKASYPISKTETKNIINAFFN